MANKRITQLDQFTGNPAANDVFVFVENSSLSTYKITYSNLLSSNNILVNSVYTNVRDNSASWEESAIIAPLQSASANWDNTYNNVSTSSANWNNTYNNVSTSSANWNNTYNNVSTSSANWNNTYTNVSTSSANWNNTYTNVSTSSANWNNTYTQFSTNSATYATIAFADAKFLPLSGGNLTGNITSTGTVSTNNDASFASLSTLNINVNNFSNTVGVSAGVYLSITVSGSAFKIPLYLV